jgi:hypothetical protein
MRSLSNTYSNNITHHRQFLSVRRVLRGGSGRPMRGESGCFTCRFGPGQGWWVRNRCVAWWSGQAGARGRTGCLAGLVGGERVLWCRPRAGRCVGERVLCVAVRAGCSGWEPQLAARHPRRHARRNGRLADLLLHRPRVPCVAVQAGWGWWVGTGAWRGGQGRLVRGENGCLVAARAGPGLVGGERMFCVAGRVGPGRWIWNGRRADPPGRDCAARPAGGWRARHVGGSAVRRVGVGCGFGGQG